MARLFTNGFEEGDTSAYTTVTGAPTVQSTVKNSGTYAMQINSLSSGAVKGALYKWASSSLPGPYFIRFYIRIDTRPSGSNHIFSVQASSGTAGTSERAKITLESNGTLILRNASTQVGSASAALTLGTWYYVEMQYYNNSVSSSDVLEARLNGTVFATSSALTVSGNIFAASFGGNMDLETNTAGNWYFDDIAINDTTGTTDLSYPGGISAGTTGQVKVWDGSAWTAKPVKVWNGSAWVIKPAKIWNGTAWVVTNY